MFFSAVDEHVPKIKLRNTFNHPWIDKELLTLIRKKERLRKKALKTRSDLDLQNFKDARRETKRMMHTKRKEHAHEARQSLRTNPKRFWSYVKSSTSQSSSPYFIREGNKFITGDLDISTALNSFFHSVFTPPNPLTDHIEYSIASASSITITSLSLSVDDVVKVLNSLDTNKASGPDEIPAALLKKTSHEIGPSICRIFNMSLNTGVVPSMWKKANITPIFKKEDPTLASNYRPISLLCILSKVLERCVHDNCYPCISSQLYQLQHGFLKKRSTTTQLLEVYHNIFDACASDEVDVIYLDLSKAFDKVPHYLLLKKLQLFGISGTLLKWFENYLTDRLQRVVLNGVSSEWLPVSSGVPQGSILGPLLFIVYVNDMPSSLSCNSNIALFADDTKLYRTIDSVSTTHQLQEDLDCVHSWSLKWRMVFNAEKCKSLHMSKKRQVNNTKYSIGQYELENVSNTKDLGITVSTDLSWSTHIEHITNKANRTLGLVKRVCGRDISDPSTRKLLYCSLVRPQLEYCASLWSPYTAKHRRLIENLQRRATKFILNYPQDRTYNDRLQSLNMLPLEYRRNIADLIQFYKFHTGTMDIELSKYALPLNTVYNTRKNDVNNYRLSIFHKQNYYNYSYFPRAIKLWNELPANIKTLPLNQFKQHLYDMFNNKLFKYQPP